MYSNIVKAYQLNKNIINKTNLIYNTVLSKKYDCNIYLKREDQQITRSFKIRGAYNKLNNLSKDEKKEGVVCASAGNHAQGVAYSCNILNIKADIFVPTNTPSQKIKAINKYCSNQTKLHIVGSNFDKCYNISTNFCKKNNKKFIHPFNDIDIIIGQGTIAAEIYEEINPDIIIGTIGGGGLMSGISLFSKYINQQCLLYGVESDGCDAMKQSIQSKKIISLQKYDMFVDGACVKQVGNITFDICNQNLTDVLTISNGHLCSKIIDLYNEHGIITEPAGALSIAGLDNIDNNIIQNKNVVCIISGSNNDITRYNEIMELSLQYNNLKHYFIIQFGQKPGELQHFVNNILGPNDDISRFEYLKKNNRLFGNVLIGIHLSKSTHFNNLIDNLQKNNIKYKYINNDELLMSYLV